MNDTERCLCIALDEETSLELRKSKRSNTHCTEMVIGVERDDVSIVFC